VVFSYDGNRPAFWGAVRCSRTQRLRVTRFLLDTGACHTCVPASRAKERGYGNDPGCKKFKMDGIGMEWTGCYQQLRFCLVSPNDFTTLLWESEIYEIVSLNELETNYGLLGTDVIRQWKEVRIQPKTNGGLIHITV